MRVLGIETSCDETAAAVVESDGRVLSDVVHTQVELHSRYGGIVPELASRDHLRFILPVVTRALEEAQTERDQIDGIAITSQPGLTGALLVGAQFAQGLAWAIQKPVVAVDHLTGHLLAAFLRYPNAVGYEPPEFPFVGLLCSGGHTALYRVEGFGLDQIFELGATRDDAAGEAFDKVAKLLGLGYPGGPIVDKLAREGDPQAINLSRPMKAKASLEFSFSGLKAEVARYVQQHGVPGDEPRLRDLCAAFQHAVVNSLVSKSVRAAVKEEVRTLVLCGGVAANRGLREAAALATSEAGLKLLIPPFAACTDNAAMIAFAGSQKLLLGQNDSGNLRVSPRTALLRVTRKGSGPRQVTSK